MSTLRSLLVVLISFFVVTQVMAQEEVAGKGLDLKPSLEVGFVSGGPNMSGAPVNISSSTRSGYAARLIGQIPDKPFEVTLGVSEQSYNSLNMGGTLGNGPDSSTLSATIRYRFEGLGEHLIPYVGGGLYQTNFDSASLQNGLLHLNDANVSGLVAEAGVRTKPFWHGLYADLNVRQYLSGSANAWIVTTVGGARMTEVTYKPSTTFEVRLGWRF